MRLIVNGKLRELDEDDHGAIPLPEMLKRFEIDPRLVAVAINGDVIPKHDFAAARVHEGDAVEIVRMVGGGA